MTEFPQLLAGARGPDAIAAHYRDAIGHGRLRSGERLPPIRAVAGRVGVTRSTVQEAYRRLADEGLVVSTVGRGTVVADGVPAERGPFSAGVVAAWEALREAPQMPGSAADSAEVAAFAELLPDHTAFPVAEFQAALQRALGRGGGELLLYGPPMGNPELRALLAERRECADPPRSPDEILVTSGAQQGIDLVLRTFTAPGDAVVAAVPTYHHLFGLLRAHGLEIVPVAQDDRGIDLEQLSRALRRPNVRLLYLMPTFHNPTGRTIDTTQREAVARIVAGTPVPVLEDEFQRDLRFRGPPLPSLRALDPRGLTVTVRTFSKGLFPGVRTGWIEGSADVLGRMSALKRLTDLETGPLLQAALVEFTRSGGLDRHLHGLRAELGRRHAAARRALAAHMPDGCTWSEPDGGFVLWVEVPGAEGERLADLAAPHGVLVTPGRLFVPAGAPCSGVRLSLARAAPERVEAGIEVLGRCAHELVAQSHPSRTRIFV